MDINTTKLPKDCNSKDEIRQQIDAIDKEIIDLFAKRFEYVSEIVKFKKRLCEAVFRELMRKDES